MTPERRLWFAALAHGLTDVAKGEDTRWIGSRDFRMVCDLVGLDPQAVEARFDPEAFLRITKAA
ncbi:MAG: hypothetical protein COW54_05980 [Rhodobacteraceae bacterium CG17_big_fil_post_rev_8_21_14_2_50_63_15]|nr:hypothetical protein [Roseovarius sp.]PIV79085.1 MAG: hypothetical protein COW54_05980 [Rhodobacteraceae bacterium CG17_big_fil_post_rev_8_21_14_2_50_63_15]